MGNMNIFEKKTILVEDAVVTSYQVPVKMHERKSLDGSSMQNIKQCYGIKHGSKIQKY